ncbi:MAG: RuBisCO accumulation factor 1 [Thermostichales cyanobacterium SZTDM-1c_bins_54]
MSPEEVVQQLRQKQGNWVSWGRWCQQLQKLGYTPQRIFEQTGFEPAIQNQLIVAAQVYGALEQSQADPAVLAHFAERGSDSLYELRILNQQERVAAASWLLAKGGNSEIARELAKAMQQFKQVRQVPEGFTNHPGDALAWECWRLARQQSDLTARTRHIAKGLRFAYSETARTHLENLLQEVSGSPAPAPPRLPWYRLESDQDCPRVIPVAGSLPLSWDAWQQVPLLTPAGSFQTVRFSGEGMWVALPGWVVLQQAQDPIAVLAKLTDLPDQPSNPPSHPQGDEEVLLLIDRGCRDWQPDRYLLAADGQGDLTIRWFAQAPAEQIGGTLLVVVRPPRVFDPQPQAWHLEE